jgi:hypothetical protein
MHVRHYWNWWTVLHIYTHISVTSGYTWCSKDRRHTTPLVVRSGVRLLCSLANVWAVCVYTNTGLEIYADVCNVLWCTRTCTYVCARRLVSFVNVYSLLRYCSRCLSLNWFYPSLPLNPALDLFSLNRQRYPEDQRDCVTLTKLYRREGRKRRNWNKTANTIKKRRRRRRWAASGGVGGMKKNKISFLPTLIANSSLLLSAEWRNSM